MCYSNSKPIYAHKKCTGFARRQKVFHTHPHQTSKLDNYTRIFSVYLVPEEGWANLLLIKAACSLLCTLLILISPPYCQTNNNKHTKSRKTNTTLTSAFFHPLSNLSCCGASNYAGTDAKKNLDSIQTQCNKNASFPSRLPSRL